MNNIPAVDPSPRRTQVLAAASAIGMVGSSGASAARIMGLLCNPQVTARDVAAVIGTEPALAARVLRVANSSYYGLSRTVSSIERALLLLGLDAIRGIAAAACLDRAVSHSGRHSIVDMRALVRHSIATAVASESVARVRHAALAADAFLAGLLHNLGTAVQLQMDRQGVAAMVAELATDPSVDIKALEARHAAVGHEECAGVVFDDWQLPEPLVAACRHHHDPMSAPQQHRTWVALVSMGSTMALESGHTYTLELMPVPRAAMLVALVGASEQDLDRLDSELPERVTDLSRGLLES